MGYWKNFGYFCHIEGLDPDKPYSHRAYELDRKGLPWGEQAVPEVDGDEPLTWDQINQATGGISGAANLPCTYCGPDKLYSRRMKITRTLAFAEYHCFYCGVNGKVSNPEPISDEQLKQDAKLIRDQEERERREKYERAMAIWKDSVALTPNTRGYQYLKERRIDLPPNPNEVLRWNQHCPFGRSLEPCIVALFRDVITDRPVGIHRIHPIGGIAEKMHLGGTKRTPMVGVIKLWPLGASKTLAVGEGIENVLSAIQLGIARTPAWAATVALNLSRVPVISDIRHLLILADNDASGKGIEAATKLHRTWTRAGRDAEITHPREVGTDFNDLLMRRAQS